MKIIKTIIVTIVLLIAIGFIGLSVYPKVRNSIFYEHPTYLPSAVEGNSLDMAGPGDLNPVISSKWYQYICGAGVNLSIRQRRGESTHFSQIDLERETNPWFEPYNGKQYSAKDFTLVESKNIDQYLFKKYAIQGVPYRIYQLSWKTSKLTLDIQADSRCVLEAGAESELIKIAESMR